MSASDQTCRTVLSQLDAQGELLVVDDEVDPIHDLSALFSLTHDTMAVQANRNKGYDMAVLGNLLSDRTRIGIALGVAPEAIQSTLLESVKKPVPPVVVDNAPVQQEEVTDGVLARLPVPTFFATETGAHIRAGMMVAVDPETGLENASYARLDIVSPTEALIGSAPNHHLAIMACKATAMGKRLPFAVVPAPIRQSSSLPASILVWATMRCTALAHCSANRSASPSA